MVSGSRFGASMIVLLVGFVAYLRGRRRPDGIYVGVVSLLTTATVYAPATVLGLLLLDRGWLHGAVDSLPRKHPPGQCCRLPARRRNSDTSRPWKRTLPWQ